MTDEIYYDELTKIHNERYFNENYQKYLDKNPNSRYIGIDFKKFKHFNDTYGHDVGDNYLKALAALLVKHFDDSIVVRMHGDEYSILTKYNEEEIINRFNLCNEDIAKLVNNSQEYYNDEIAVTSVVPVEKKNSIMELLPEKFSFNAGIVLATKDMKNSQKKADTMMYIAKKNNESYQFFEPGLWREKEMQKDFVENVANDINTDKLTYYQRKIKDKNGNTILEISTRDSQGNSIFSDKNYNILRSNLQLQKVDLYNLNNLFVNLSNNINQDVIINLDYKSILSKRDLLPYIMTMIEKNKIDPSKIILSINMNDIESHAYKLVIFILNELKKIGFKICIDKYSDKTPDIFFNEIDVDYLKIDNKYWKEIMYKTKAAKMLAAKIKIFKEIGNVKTIITCIENEQELGFVKNLTNNDTSILTSGNYLSEEKEFKVNKSISR